MTKYIAEKRCAGKVNFAPGQEVTMSDKDAAPFVKDGSLRPAVAKKKAVVEKKAAEAGGNQKGK